MKILYLFLVYKNCDIVSRIIQNLSSEDSFFLIHVDKNAKEDFSTLSKFKNVLFVKNRFSTKWGSFELCYSVISALKEISDMNYNYVVLLSESDYPVKTGTYIANFLAQKDQDFILTNILPNKNPLEVDGGHWLEDGRRRLECYALRVSKKQIATIEPRKINWGNIRQLAKIIRYNPLKFIQAFELWLCKEERRHPVQYIPCGGHQWFMLRKSTIDYIIKYLESDSSYLEYSRDTQIPDEIIFPTLVNHFVKEKSKISKNIHRYISWGNDGDISPRDITMFDKPTIDRCLDDGDILFMRKISDKKVCDYIDVRLNSNDSKYNCE